MRTPSFEQVAQFAHELDKSGLPNLAELLLLLAKRVADLERHTRHTVRRNVLSSDSARTRAKILH